MKEITLISAASAFGHKQKLVGVAINSRNFDFSWQVVASVHFVVHRQRSHLAITKIAREVGVVDPAGDGLLVATTGKNELAFFTFDNCCASVLAHR